MKPEDERSIDLLASAAIKRRALQEISGLRLFNPYMGSFKTLRLTVRLFIQSEDLLRFTAAAPHSLSAREALRLNGELPGNVRFGGPANHQSILADTQIDGVAHLPDSFRHIRAGYRRAVSNGRYSMPATAPVEAGGLAAAIEQTSLSDEPVALEQNGWELQSRLPGFLSPLRVVAEKHTVRLYTTLLKAWPDGQRGEAVADFSVRFNDRTRFARLAEVGGRLVAESRLHAGQVSPNWLTRTAHALAAAAQHSRPALDALAQRDDVAAHYATVFLTSRHPQDATERR